MDVQSWVTNRKGKEKVSGVIHMTAAWHPSCAHHAHLHCCQLHMATPEHQVWQFSNDSPWRCFMGSVKVLKMFRLFLSSTTMTLHTDDLKMEEEYMVLGAAHSRMWLEGKDMGSRELSSTVRKYDRA